MTIGLVAPLTNGAYGVGRGGRRRVKPLALACIHVTGNSRTAADPNLHAAAQGERNYANRAGSNGPSATGYCARDGWAVLAVDPVRYFAWSNGDVSAPNTANPGIRRVLALRAKGYNANEAYWEEWELLGFGTSYPITPAQERFVAERLAARSKAAGLPINRETVHGHWEINGVDRRNCPVPYAKREVFLNRVIALARSIAAPVPVPAPTPQPAEDDMPPITSYTPGLVASVKPTANVRSAPSLKAEVLRAVTIVEAWAIAGWVRGDVDPDSGSDQWICRFAGGRWEYTAKANLSAGPVDLTPYSQAQVDAASTGARIDAARTLKAVVDAKAAELGA